MGNWIPRELLGTPCLSSLPMATLRGLLCMFINSEPEGTRQAWGGRGRPWTLLSVHECMCTGILVHTCRHAQLCVCVCVCVCVAARVGMVPCPHV